MDAGSRMNPALGRLPRPRRGPLGRRYLFLVVPYVGYLWMPLVLFGASWFVQAVLCRPIFTRGTIFSLPIYIYSRFIVLIMSLNKTVLITLSLCAVGSPRCCCVPSSSAWSGATLLSAAAELAERRSLDPRPHHVSSSGSLGSGSSSRL